jgi:hypothetical protein
MNTESTCKDVFGRKLEVGDTILCVPSVHKNFLIKTVIGFWGKNGYVIDYLNMKLKNEFIILKRKSGIIYFNDDCNPLNCWSTNHKDTFI